MLLYLTDSHPGKIVDLTNFLESVRPILSSDDNAVMSFRMIDPVLASFPSTINATLRVDGKARSSLKDRTPVSLYDGELFLASFHWALGIV